MSTKNHLSQTNHLLVINRPGAETLELMIQDFALPGVSVETVGGAAKKLSGFNIVGTAMNFGPLSLNIMLDENLDSWFSIYEWLKELVNPDYGMKKTFLDSVSQVQVHILTNNKTNNKFVVEFKDVWPTSIGELPFATNVDDDTILTFTAEFEYKSYKIDRNGLKT